MRHDTAENSCDPSLHIMSPTLGSGKTTWSKCSRTYLNMFLEWVSPQTISNLNYFRFLISSIFVLGKVRRAAFSIMANSWRIWTIRPMVFCLENDLMQICNVCWNMEKIPPDLELRLWVIFAEIYTVREIDTPGPHIRLWREPFVVKIWYFYSSSISKSFE